MRIPTLSDIVVISSLLCLAALIWVLDPNARKSNPYKDELDD